MIHNNGFKIQSSNYLKEYKVGFGILEKIKVNNGVIPYCNSSIDQSSPMAFIKAYSEFLERTRIGYNTFEGKNSFVFDIINNKYEEIYSSYIGYGFNDKFGVLDTTGTASGLDSIGNMTKSLYELIEKNELMLLWYKNMGQGILQTQKIRSLIADIGFDSDEIYIYMSRNISNAYCITVIVLNNNKIISSGVSFDLDIKISMKNALLEAKMIEKIYGKNSQSPYSRYNLEEHNLICKYVKQINSCIEHIDFESLYYDIEEKLVLTNWIDNLYYVVLNTKRYQRFLSIRCLSTKLICCLPTKKHIEQMSDKEIIKRYNILENLDIIPNCCVL